jgi:hypothetical protein
MAIEWPSYILHSSESRAFMTLMIVFNSWFLLLVFRFGSVSFLLERDCTKLGSVIEQLWAFFVGCFFFTGYHTH